MTPEAATPLLERRREQMFPVLSPAQIQLARRFGGPERRAQPGEIVVDFGERGAPAFLVLTGTLDVSVRDAFGRTNPVATHGPGELSGEISQLAGGPSYSQGCAGTAGAAIVPFDAAQVRRLVVSTSDVGEIVMRAFILRRVFLIQTGAGLVLLGEAQAPQALRLQNFLSRNGIPYTLLDPNSDPDSAQLIARLGISKADLPLAICPDGSVLRSPTEKAIGQRLGLSRSLAGDRSYDVAIVGAGPSGLAAAVYAASEGLSTVVFDARAFGGQAGASARIENYLGFPTGISGEALAGRAYAQAQKFGAVMAIPVEVEVLSAAPDVSAAHGRAYSVALDEGNPVRASTVVIASGARYRKLDLPNLSLFEGQGVHYWASPIEATLCARSEVVVIGGGNSAGQGVVFLADLVTRVHLLLRGRDLGENMSHYLVERIAALPNVDVHAQTELTQLIGDAQHGLQAVSWQERSTGRQEQRPIRHVFLFLGAAPNTDWLKRCAVSVDDKGFVQTGNAAIQGGGSARGSLPLETTLPGVFAVGDVRAGSIKRVSAAVGEGAAVVAQIHEHLHQLRSPAPDEPRSRGPRSQ